MKAEPLPANRRSRRRHLFRLLGAVLLLVIVASVGWGYRLAGRTPGELLDYAEGRMLGHPQVGALAQPVVAGLRSWFDAPSGSDRAQLPFTVPPPPPRRGPADIRPAEPAPAGARVWRVGPTGPLSRIEDAARLARSGDIVEIEAGDYRQDVALWEQKRLTIRGVGGAARLFADGRNKEGKAIWVIRHGDFDISNIDFIGAKVADGNGAGIRFEGGSLRVRDCLFWGNQMGLMTVGAATDANATVLIEGSEFAYSHVDGRWGHNLYVGTLDRLTVTGSYFHHAGVGHLLKSRARVNEILYNRLTDETGGRASYELEFPNGGLARVVGNLIQQQSGTENSVMVSFGAEGYKWPVNTLMLGSNTLVNDHPHGGTFLRVAPGAGRVVSANNLRVGPGGDQVEGDLMTHNDQVADWESFVMAARQDFRLRSPGAARAYRRPADPELARLLEPHEQYVHPRTLQSLTPAPVLVGADQRPGS